MMGVESVLQSIGYIGIFLCVFIECGVLLGLFVPLPGWSLLFAAGVFAVNDRLNLWIVLASGLAGAILGYVAGYYTGKRYGRKLFYEVKTEKYFTKGQGLQTEHFMQKYGYSALIIGRFLPIVHNVIPIMSGIARTPFAPFMAVNVFGGIVWVTTATMFGYVVGRSVPNAQYMVIPLIIVLTLALNARPVRRRIKQMISTIEK